MVVRRTPEGHGGAEGPDRRVRDAGVDDGGDPGAAALGAQAVLVVVAPDEELGARQADPLDQGPGEQDAVERDHDVADQAVRSRRRATSPIACTVRVPPGSRIGKTSRSGSVSSTTTGPQKSSAPSWASRVSRQPGLRQAVVVHQPDQVGAALDGPAQALVEAARAPGVVGQVPRVQALDLGLGGPEPLPRAVGGGVVDDQDLVEPIGLGQGPDEALEQVEPVERDHDGGDAAVGRGHLAKP